MDKLPLEPALHKLLLIRLLLASNQIHVLIIKELAHMLKQSGIVEIKPPMLLVPTVSSASGTEMSLIAHIQVVDHTHTTTPVDTPMVDKSSTSGILNPANTLAKLNQARRLINHTWKILI
jgi:hypothetical protein